MSEHSSVHVTDLELCWNLNGLARLLSDCYWTRVEFSEKLGDLKLSRQKKFTPTHHSWTRQDLLLVQNGCSNACILCDAFRKCGTSSRFFYRLAEDYWYSTNIPNVAVNSLKLEGEASNSACRSSPRWLLSKVWRSELLVAWFYQVKYNSPIYFPIHFIRDLRSRPRRWLIIRYKQHSYLEHTSDKLLRESDSHGTPTLQKALAKIIVSFVIRYHV